MKKIIFYTFIMFSLVACSSSKDENTSHPNSIKKEQKDQKAAATPHFKAEPLPPETKYKNPKL